MKNDTAPLLPMPIKVKPYEHQVTAFNFVCKKLGLLPDSTYSSSGYGAALLMEMGTGKSLTALAVAGALYNAGRTKRVLVVAPLSVVGVWDEEFGKYAAYDYTLAVLNGGGEKKADTLRHLTGNSLHVAVINYESGWRLE